MVLPGCRLSLTALINPTGKLPHRHAQRVFVCVMLDPAMLAIAYYNEGHLEVSRIKVPGVALGLRDDSGLQSLPFSIALW